MYGRFAIVIAFTFQIYHHCPMTGNALITMIDLPDLAVYLLFLGIVLPFTVLLIIIVGIRVYA